MSHCFTEHPYHLTLPPAMSDKSSFFMSVTTFGIITIFYCSHSNRCVVLSLYAVTTSIVDIFSRVYKPSLVPLQCNVSSCLMPLPLMECLIIYSWALRVLYTVYQSFIRQVFSKLFSRSASCHFIFLTRPFTEQHFLILKKSSYVICIYESCF